MTMCLMERKNNMVIRRQRETGKAAHFGFFSMIALVAVAITVILAVDAAATYQRTVMHYTAASTGTVGGAAPISVMAAGNMASSCASVVDGGGSAR